jgi:hypothetical protein
VQDGYPLEVTPSAAIQRNRRQDVLVAIRDDRFLWKDVSPDLVHSCAREVAGDVDVAPVRDGLTGAALGAGKRVPRRVVLQVRVCDLQEPRLELRRRSPRYGNAADLPAATRVASVGKMTSTSAGSSCRAPWMGRIGCPGR